MKKLINRPEAVVEEMIAGLVAVYPGLTRLPGRPVVVRADAAKARSRQVAVISGGGSGHEPAHAGYVGAGMLSAAVLGEVFTSPAPDAVLAAIRAVTGPPGLLLIVKNYTGDRLNFGLAAELARADGLKVEVVVVADDVALADSAEGSHAGRRGLAGTVLVHKIAGAAAAAGRDLYEVASEARAAAESVATMGVALAPCTLPAAGKPGFELGPTEIELGLGIHGEPGARRASLELADVLTDRLINAIAADARLASGERVALLVNNLGGTPTMELAVVARRAVEHLEARGLVVERAYLGTFLSALEMAGTSLSVLRVDGARLARLDAPTEAPAWPNPAAVARPRTRTPAAPPAVEEQAAAPTAVVEPPRTPLGQALGAAILAASSALTDASSRLTELDRAVGDGDLGISLERGAQAVRAALPGYPLDDPPAALHALGRTLQASLGGTSGPLYAVFFLRAASRLKSAAASTGSFDDPRLWAEAFRLGCEGIIELGGAGRGDRTMLDALLPACDALFNALDAGNSLVDALSAAADAAELGARATADLIPRRGRSSYLGQRAIGHVDPGAEAAAIWLRAVAREASRQSS
jgi:triose/dihydroxyacetone kinase / FAD-AMP lyase (cyclizing)